MTDHRHVYKIKTKYYGCIACSKKLYISDAQEMLKRGMLTNMYNNDLRTLFEPLPEDTKDGRRNGNGVWAKASTVKKARMLSGLNRGI